MGGHSLCPSKQQLKYILWFGLACSLYGQWVHLTKWTEWISRCGLPCRQGIKMRWYLQQARQNLIWVVDLSWEINVGCGKASAFCSLQSSWVMSLVQLDYSVELRMHGKNLKDRKLGRKLWSKDQRRKRDQWPHTQEPLKCWNFQHGSLGTSSNQRGKDKVKPSLNIDFRMVYIYI